MKRSRRLWALLFAAVGCASSEGGPVGSGISSSVSGNVVEVQLEGAAAAENAELPVTLRVSVDERPGLDAVIDPRIGEFEIEGDLDGEVTLRFTDVDHGVDLATLPVLVPAGAAVVLDDLVIETSGVEPRTVHQRRFAGHVREVDCAGETLHLVEPGPRARSFIVRVSADTEIVRPDGQAADCAAIQRGSPLLVEESVLDPDGEAIEAIQLVVAPESTPQGPIVVRRHGNVVRNDCASGVVHIHDPAFSELVRVRLTATTELVCLGGGSPRACACAEIEFGDRVVIEARTEPRRPGALEALRVAVHERPSTFIAQIFGPVLAVDCSARTLRVDDPRVANDPLVRLIDGTEIFCVGTGRPMPCACTDIRPRARAEVDVVVNVQRPDAVDAVRIRTRRR